MKLNKEEIIFKADGKKTCDYCGRSSFSHKHPVNTLPKDFEPIEREEECPNCLRCGDDISGRQLRQDGIIYCYECENRLELLRGDLEFMQCLKDGTKKTLEFSARMIKAKKQQLNNI